MFRASIAVFVTAFALMVPLSSLMAADYLPKDTSSGGAVVVSSGEVYQNLYVGGGSVSIGQEILGDLFAAGGSVQVAGPIEEDFFGAAGNINISSPVGGDARLGGGNISITAPISGDLLVGGGTITLGSDATVGGDLWLGGGVVTITGDVAGDVMLTGGEVYINSTIAGELKVWAEQLTFGPNAQVEGLISYTGNEEAILEEGALVSEITYSEKIYNDHDFKYSKGLKVGWTMLIILKIISLLLGGLIALKVFGKLTQEIANSAHKQFWSNIGIGLLASIAIPIISVVCIFSGLLTFVGIVSLSAFGLVTILSGLYGLMYLGAALEQLFKKRKTLTVTWTSVILGVLSGGVLAMIPVLGWVALWVLFLTAFGSILRVFQKRLS